MKDISFTKGNNSFAKGLRRAAKTLGIYEIEFISTRDMKSLVEGLSRYLDRLDENQLTGAYSYQDPRCNGRSWGPYVFGVPGDDNKVLVVSMHSGTIPVPGGSQGATARSMYLADKEIYKFDIKSQGKGFAILRALPEYKKFVLSVKRRLFFIKGISTSNVPSPFDDETHGRGTLVMGLVAENDEIKVPIKDIIMMGYQDAQRELE